MPAPTVPYWALALSDELDQVAGTEQSSIEERRDLAISIRDLGPSLFGTLRKEAADAAHFLRYEFHSSANWFTVKNAHYPFRMLQANLDVYRLGIGLIYTRGSMRGNAQPKTQNDFIDIRVEPPGRNLLLLYHGRAVSISEAVDLMFREAFLPKQEKNA